MSKVTLKSSDGETFEVDLVIEYCKKHVESSKSDDRSVDEDLKQWDAEFVKVDQSTLFDLILAANYLNVKSLLGLTCQTVADMIKGKTPEEIRKTFNIKNNFTPEEEEEEEVRRENQWAFEGEHQWAFEGENLLLFEEEHEWALE
ncbi:hypothetical protein Ancab_017348 [Ancistrocladus abbreviatus]